MKQHVIYIAGVKQHAGKTVSSLGIISALIKKIDPARIGYIKPVGQELKTLPDGTKVDKDAVIIEKFCQLKDLDLKMVSPVRIGSGVTKQYLATLEKGSITEQYERDIMTAVRSMHAKDVIIAEGTGHPGVGSIVGLSNARVSNLLQAKILYLAGGGLGSTIDEMDIMMTYFHASRCQMKGVIFNKVLPDKLLQMRTLLTEKFLNKHFDYLQEPLSIYGFLPVIDDLSKPSMEVIKDQCFPDAFIVGKIMTDPAWRVPARGIKIISLANKYFSPEKYGVHERQIPVIGAGSINRLHKILDYNMTLDPANRIAGIILTCGEATPNYKNQIKMIEASGIPAIYVNHDTATTDSKIYKCFSNTKLQVYDNVKHEEIVNMFTQGFDVDKFIHDMEIEL
ncbi:MAG: hypothetical protein EOL87_10935 [Spartobacteria bacterium]|nr:hypothetical protein [Spartobacteria bacterium]